MLKKLTLLTLALILSLSVAPVSLAQNANITVSSDGEDMPVEEVLEPALSNLIEDEIVSEDAILDTEVTASDLEVDEITKMPSGIGNWWGGFKQKMSIAFTFNPIKKAEKQLHYADERMARAQYMVENAKNSKTVEKAQKMIEQSENYVDRVREKLATIKTEPAKIEKLKDKYLHQAQLHHQILEKMENRVPEDVLIKIKEKREAYLERFKQGLEKFDGENKEKIAERMERVFEMKKGSDLKPLKDLEFIEQLKEKYPEEKQAILNRVKVLHQKLLAKKLGKMDPKERQQKLENYVKHTETQNEEKHHDLLERRHMIMNQLTNRKDIEIDPTVRKQLQNVKERTQKQIQNNKKLIIKKEALETQANNGNEKSKNQLELLQQRQFEVRELKQEQIREIKPHILPAYDETKFKPGVGIIKPEPKRPTVKEAPKVQANNKTKPQAQINKKPVNKKKNVVPAKKPLPAKNTKK
jgi:hypothetical protein